MKKIYVIGAGVEGQEGFSRRALDLVMQADILFGRPKQLELFPDFPGEKVHIDQNLSDVVNRLKSAQGKAVVLASGDPLFFGIGRQLLRNFREDELEFVPNVSSVQYAFAKLGIPWDDAVFFSCKGRAAEDVVDRIVANDKAAVLTDAQNTPGSIARQMIRRGREDMLLTCAKTSAPMKSVSSGPMSAACLMNRRHRLMFWCWLNNTKPLPKRHEPYLVSPTMPSAPLKNRSRGKRCVP